jgi:MFS family permease
MSPLLPAVPRDGHDPYAALRHPKFSRYIVCLFALTLGIQIQGTVVGWQMYDLTKDPLALGLIGLAEALPALSTALYAGHVADQRDRRTISLIALGVLVCCSVALWVLAGPAPLGLDALTIDRVTAIYGVIIVSGVARAFLQPARQALSAELVPRALFKNAITWRSGTWQLASVAGPALGGLLYAVGGTLLAFAVDAVLMLIAVVVLLSINHRSPVREGSGEGVWESVAGGVRFVVREPVILGALTLDLFSVGPIGLGVLRAAPAAGAVAMSLVLARHHDFERTGHTLLWAVAGFGACMIGFGLSTTFWLSVALLFVAGLCDMISVVIRSTLLQARTPEGMLGRVSSVNQLFIGSSNEIGMFESGVTARWFGTAPSVVIGGCATLVVVGSVAWFVPVLRRLGRLHPDERVGV